MVNQSRVNKLLSLLVILVILLFSSGSLALAQDGVGEDPIQFNPNLLSAPQAPVPGGPGFLMIHASAFTPESNLAQYGRTNVLWSWQGSPNITYYAPVYLPDGATITQLVYFFSDSDPTQLTRVRFYRYPLPTMSEFQIATVASPLNPALNVPSEVHVSVNYIVDNQAEAYYLLLVLPAGSGNTAISASAVRIDYSCPSPSTVYCPVVIR